MKAVLYVMVSKKVIMVVNDVKSVGINFIKGSSEVNGIDMSVADYVVIEDSIPITLGQVLPEGLKDYSDSFWTETTKEKIKQLDENQTMLMSAIMELAESHFGGV